MYWRRAPLLSIFPHLLLAASSARATKPSALSATPSTHFYGDDGAWSAISIRVGTPQQWVDVLVSTGSSETWVVGLSGCDKSQTCATDRGGLFRSNESSTWKSQGLFALGLDPQLGFAGAGDYGLDILEFGTTGLSMKDSIIGVVNDTSYWAGFLGVGIVPGNFTTMTALSPISNLVETAGLIPSHSYGYTAGANYQQKGTLCSLTLGGYDASRFMPHNVTFDLSPIQQPELFLDSISVSKPPTSAGNLSSNPLPLLSHAEGISVTIDSSTPYLWLPKSICERFAAAFGLTYNTTLSLYTFDGNSSRHDDLKTWGLNFTFTLTNNGTSSEAINITLPYNSFDLQLSYPFIKNTTWGTDASKKYYFPLRQADNDTQYTIGRSFLQEAYMIVDYERNHFSVHQAIHNSNALTDTQIVDITRPGDSSFTSPAAKSSGLPIGAIVGIAVGAAALLASAILIFWFLRRKRRAPLPEVEKDDAIPPPQTPGSKSTYTVDSSAVRSPMSVSTEVDSVANERHEMYAPPPDPTELDAGPSAVARTPRDGTEKVKFTTYQQALFRDNVSRGIGGASSSLAVPDELEPIPASRPASSSTAPAPDPDPVAAPLPTAKPAPLSAAAFLARMIEKKNGKAAVDDSPRTRGRRGDAEQKDRDRERGRDSASHEQEPPPRANARDSWAPGDDSRARDQDEIRPDGDGDGDGDGAGGVDVDVEERPRRTSKWLARSESIAKNPKVLVMGRQSFMRGRRHAVP